MGHGSLRDTVDTALIGRDGTRVCFGGYFIPKLSCHLYQHPGTRPLWSTPFDLRGSYLILVPNREPTATDSRLPTVSHRSRVMVALPITRKAVGLRSFPRAFIPGKPFSGPCPLGGSLIPEWLITPAPEPCLVLAPKVLVI